MKSANRVVLVLAGVVCMSTALGRTVYAQDCNQNEIADDCDLDCGFFGGPCDVSGCGESMDCNASRVPDECELAENDCNANTTPDECDGAPSNLGIVFATGMAAPQDIVPTSGDYPPGYFVVDVTADVVWHMSPLGGTVTSFSAALHFPIGAAFTGPEFACRSETLLVADRGAPEDPDIVAVLPDGTVEAVAELPDSRIAIGLTYIPASTDGPAEGSLAITGVDAAYSTGRVYVITGDCEIRQIAHSEVFVFWSPAVAPQQFGEYGHQLFISEGFGNRIFTLDLQTGELGIFAEVPFGTTQVGLRQIAFSPSGWAGAIDPGLGSESVLLVSVASSHMAQDVRGTIAVLDQRGRWVGVMTPQGGDLSMEPRGLLFVGPDLLVGDTAPGHGYLRRASVSDFRAGDCNCNGIPDNCDVEHGAETDANDNGFPDECETWVGDFDGNCRVDLDDYYIWVSYFGGPAASRPPVAADSDRDWDVDLADYAAFTRQFTGSR